jgi:hypothetical protein
MKTEFTVPEDLIMEFAEILSENELTNEIIGTTEDDELIIEVHFEKAEFNTVQKLADLIESNDDDENDED